MPSFRCHLRLNLHSSILAHQPDHFLRTLLCVLCVLCSDRISRTSHSAISMGETVIAGAVTTLGSGMVMVRSIFPCVRRAHWFWLF
jgi:hypothetical protein